MRVLLQFAFSFSFPKVTQIKLCITRGKIFISMLLETDKKMLFLFLWKINTKNGCDQTGLMVFFDLRKLFSQKSCIFISIFRLTYIL